jgi:DNA modification methylase
MSGWQEKYLNRIVQGDCLELMRELPDKCVDAVVTDVLYGVNGGSGTIGKSRNNKHAYDMCEDTEEYILTCCVPAIRESIRVAKRVIFTPGPKYLCHYPNPDSFGVFYQPATTALQKWGRADAQPIFYYGIDPNVGKTITFCSFVMTERPELNGHPCPKPINTWKELIYKASNEGDIILDPFLGSGTTAVAALRTGRQFIGMEISPEYCAIAQKRVDAELAQTKLEL